MRYTRLLTLLFLFFIYLFIAHKAVFSQSACTPASSTCNAFSCYDEVSQDYIYNTNECTVSNIAGSCFVATSIVETPSSRRLNTNPNPAPWPSLCGSLPSGCGQGMQGDNIPTCSGDEGGQGGDCPGNGPSAGGCLPGNCGICDQYIGQCCSSIPSGCWSELSGCSEGGGGAPTATPTPTPTPVPSCTLACPGTQIPQSRYNDLMTEAGVKGASTDLLAQGTGTGGTGTGGTGTGVGGTDEDPSETYYMAAGIAEGDVLFNGYDNFDCFLFTDDNGYAGACPEPTPGTGHGTTGGSGTDVLGAATRRIASFLPSSFISYLRSTKIAELYGKVLGSSTQLLAQGTGTGGTGGTGTGTGIGDTTWTQSVKYHELNESKSEFYTAMATHRGSGSGGVGTGGSDTYSCSCSVALVCPATASDVNDDSAIQEGCDNQCDFSVDPALTIANSAVTITVDTPPGFSHVFMDLDDGTNIEDGSTTIEHTYINSGVYDIALTCATNGNGNGETRSCTRRFTSYCEGTDLEGLPTPTPTPTPTPGPWIKVQDSSFHLKTYTNNTVPADATQYDGVDVGRCSASNPNPFACFNTGEAGAVTTKSNDSTFGSEVSEKGWLRNDINYTLNNLITPASYIEYVKARKDYANLESLSVEQLQSNIVNLIASDTPASITDDSIPDRIGTGEGMVIIIDGDLIIDMALAPNQTFNASKKAVTFIVNGNIEISSATTELNGIFIANNVDFAYDASPTTTTPLKVVGNISVMNTPDELCQEKRVRADLTKPVCKFDFDFVNQFVPNIDKLSTRTYEWTELVPTAEN